MQTIWEFPVPNQDDFTREMPDGAVILSVAMLHGDPVMWARVDTSAPMRPRTFTVVGTGYPMPSGAKHWSFIGSFQLLGGRFVGHLFERGSF